ncbi:hypothetical protein ACTQ42_04460 [Streptococcus alactolyticus]|nr:hypothetical protein [Streptococcus alactolyticus]
MTILAIVFGILLIFAIVRVVQIKMGVTKRFGYHYHASWTEVTRFDKK